MQQNGQIRSLTALRFFAAALVVVFHFARPRNPLLETFIGHGAYGVAIFFVLSGFILSYSYSLGPGILRGNLRAFWVARLARLYPVYVLGILLFVPILLRAVDVPAWQRMAAGVLALTVTQAWFHLLGTSWGMWNPPGWSLSAEAFFYLLFPLFCLPLSRLPARWLMGVALACWGVSLLGMGMHALVDAGGDDFWAFVPLIRLPEFVLGVAAGLAWKNRRTTAFDAIAPATAPAAAVLMLAALCLPIDATWFFSGALAPLAALLICSLACNRGRLARCLSWQPLVTLGCASYALYILHWPAWLIGKHFFGQSRFATQQPNVYFIVYFIVTTALAVLCCRYVEEPMNRFLRNRWMPSSADGRRAGGDAVQPGEAGEHLPSTGPRRG